MPKKDSKKKSVWIKICGLKKTKSRPDMLKGKLTIPDFGLEIPVIAFIKTDTQKRTAGDDDVSIFIVEDKIEENPFEDLP